MRPAAIRLATRGSALALWQAEWVKARLEALGHPCDLVIVETQGDREQLPFARLEGQGFFVKAVQDALLAGRADLAVHSYKDLPGAPVAGLEVAAVPPRADPRDVLLVRPGKAGAESGPLLLEEGARVGTGAVRRRRQLIRLRPDLHLEDLRGNVPTRIDRLRAGHFDAIVLAAAGLERLNPDLSDLIATPLAPEVLVPAPAQGALALEIRRDDYDLAALLTDLHHVPSYRTVAAERGLMTMLQGGCQLALGAHAVLGQGAVRLRAWFEGHTVEVAHPSPEGAAMLAYEGLGRPTRAPTAPGGATP